MSTKRIIPFLMLHNEQLFNSTNFDNYRYIGDPLIAMKIFNEKEAQEICIVDIDPTKYGKEINFNLLSDIASECFMPLSYGGGVNSLETIQKILFNGFEKVIINSALVSNFNLLAGASSEFGSSTIIACIDFVETKDGCFVKNSHVEKMDVLTYAKLLEENGAGEILLNNISKDGTKLGVNTALIHQISKNVSVPIIAAGGIGSLDHISDGLKSGASAIAATSLFVYKGNLDAVLINYPEKSIITKIRTDHD